MTALYLLLAGSDCYYVGQVVTFGAGSVCGFQAGCSVRQLS